MRKRVPVVAWLALTALVAMGLALPAHAADCSVRGRVADSSGRPAGSVWVVLSQGDEERARTLADDGGLYYMGSLKPGSYTLKVRRGGTTLAQRDVTLSGNDTCNLTIP